TYDYTTIHTLINTCPILHLSFTDPSHPFPVLLPMIGSTGNFSTPDADPATTSMDIYLHGYVSGRVFKSASTSDSEAQGLPVSLAATFLDGLVLALSPFHNSCNYRSAIVYGHAVLVTDEAEALYALHCITNAMLPQRWEDSRQPPTKAEMASTSVLRVRVQTASAKVRAGGPSEDRVDAADGGLRERVWTGVVPYWGTWGEGVGAQGCEREVPESVEAWRVGENGRARVGAFEAAMQ
ncbi:hypothetical protein P153DRAFT_298994, partial [Dothidotthia symphoricarpi CBS 119687]